jgi:7-cyano-7-deazaguanine synthase
MLILFSGGVDSTAVAWDHRFSNPALFFVDFNQPARQQERRAANALAARMQLELIEHTTRLPGVDAMSGSGPRVMPGRNLALLALAVSAAAVRGMEHVLFGAIADDQPDYPDCRVEFVHALRTTTEVAYGIRVDAPFLHLRKRQVMAALPTDVLALTWSCYAAVPSTDGLGRPCGTCNSCLLRNAP